MKCTTTSSENVFDFEKEKVIEPSNNECSTCPKNAKVMAKNRNGSYSIHTKIISSQGKTIKFFDDTFDKTSRFIHRGWTDAIGKIYLWWNGIKQYGEHFFQNR